MSPAKDDAKFDELLKFLRRSRGFDFTGYKRPSLMRRVNRRMEEVKVDDYGSYVEYLELHPEEFVTLFNTILINVTSFFRDRAAWEYLAEEILPRLTASGDPIRVWSAGCASGEEAYTLAMLLCEAIGPERFGQRVKIYATDVDEEALAAGRNAAFGAKEIEPVPEHLRARYFRPSNGRFVFQPELRRALIFGRHDLIQDAPISRLDLLVCRNTLMYFDAETQAKVLSRFSFALKENGYLFAGKAEMLFSHAELFTPVHLRYRIFARAPGAERREPVFPVAIPEAQRSENREATPQARVRDLALEALSLPTLVIDAAGVLVQVNARARVVFSVPMGDRGRPFRDLELSYRPVELRGRIDAAHAERRTLTFDAEGLQPDGERQRLRVRVTPLFDGVHSAGTVVTFEDVTEMARQQEELSNVRQQLETAHEELQSANEELETTNEELQSANEELETTNEELQSTNEELETMNEELQSTNAELDTINKDLNDRSDRLEEANVYLESVLGSIESGVVVLDRDFIVQVWSKKAEDLWGVRGEEAHGVSLFSLDIGLPAESLREAVVRTIAGSDGVRPVVLEATNRRGKPIQCRISTAPFRGRDDQIRGVIMLMEEWRAPETVAPAGGNPSPESVEQPRKAR